MIDLQSLTPQDKFFLSNLRNNNPEMTPQEGLSRLESVKAEMKTESTGLTQMKSATQRMGITPPTTTGISQEKPGFIERAKEITKNEFGRAKEIAGTARGKLETGEPIEGAAKTFTAGTKAVLSPITGVVGAAVQPVAENIGGWFKEKLQTGLKSRLGEEEGQRAYERLGEKATQHMTQAIQDYEALPSDAKTAAQLVGSLMEIWGAAEGVGQIKNIPKTLTKGKRLLAKGATWTEEALDVAEKNALNNALLEVDDAIDEGIRSGVKPGLNAEKKTLGGMAKYEKKARDAVKAIVDNKEKLSLVDEFGDTVEGGLPESLKQFSDSINQTKKQIFDQYDNLAKAAGKTGEMIDLKKIGNELTKIIDNKVLNTENPSIVKYAQERIARYAKTAYTPEEAQEAIKILNQSLDTFYKNPSYDSASKAYVDSLIANMLRNNLDNLIEKATGSEYQALKSQYGALRSIEKDVVHRTLVDARKNAKGLMDVTDILSGGEAVAGLLSLNPAMIAKATTQKGIKEYFKYLNDPNVIIKNMFKKVDELKDFKPTATSIKEGIEGVKNLKKTLKVVQ